MCRSFCIPCADVYIGELSAWPLKLSVHLWRSNVAHYVGQVSIHPLWRGCDGLLSICTTSKFLRDKCVTFYAPVALKLLFRAAFMVYKKKKKMLSQIGKRSWLLPLGDSTAARFNRTGDFRTIKKPSDVLDEPAVVSVFISWKTTQQLHDTHFATFTYICCISLEFFL